MSEHGEDCLCLTCTDERTLREISGGASASPALSATVVSETGRRKESGAIDLMDAFALRAARWESEHGEWGAIVAAEIRTVNDAWAELVGLRFPPNEKGQP